MKAMSKPLAACLSISLIMLIATMASQLHYRQFRNEQQQHVLLLQALKDGSHQLLIEAQNLLREPERLSSIQTYQDRNIVDFQHITKGSLKHDLAPLDNTASVDLSALSASFDRYSVLVSSLIQSRSKLSQLADKKDEMVLGARTLAEKAANLAQGIVQYGAHNGQISASYEVALLLTNHSLNVNRVFDHGARYIPLNLDTAREALSVITTGKNASDSAILRRSATSLLENIEAFANSSNAVSEYEKLAKSISQEMTQLADAQNQLEKAIEPIAESTVESGSFGFLLTLITTALAVVAALTGALIALRYTSESNSSPAPRPLPEPASEVTGSFYLNQIKTDKNKLINDIRPLADGILYIKADEHFESTSDLARCFNHSREALIQKIEALRVAVTNLQDALANKRHPEHHSVEVNINSSPIEDLTFKAQAELEGISRRIKAQAADNNDHRKLILTQCMRADNLLDEIRVRIRKGWQEVSQELNDPSTNTDSAYETKIELMVTQLIGHLDEFQTKAPAKRTKKVS